MEIQISETTELIIKHLSKKAIPPNVKDFAKEIGISLRVLVEQLALLENYDVAKFHHTALKNTVQKLPKFSEVYQAGSFENYLKLKEIRIEVVQNDFQSKAKGEPQKPIEVSVVKVEINIVRGLIEEGDLDKAIQEMKKIKMSKTNSDCLLQLTSRYSRLKKEKIEATIGFENRKIEENAITRDLIELCGCV